MFSDARVKQFWDPDRIFGSLMSQTLNLLYPSLGMFTFYTRLIIPGMQNFRRHLNFGCTSKMRK
jgi:hypothetical protein